MSELREGIYQTRPIMADSANLRVGKPQDRFAGKCSDEERFYPETLKWSEMGAPKSSAKCMFVYPGITSPGWNSCREGQTSNEAVYMSHGMAYVSSALKARGHLSWLLDMRTCRHWKDFENQVREAKYDVAFIGFLSLDVFTATCAVRSLKEIHPDRPVIVGGLHVSCCEMKSFPAHKGEDYWLPDLYLNRIEDMHPVLRQYLDYKGEADYEDEKFVKADCTVWNESEIAACLLAEEIAGGGTIPKFVNAKVIPDLSETPHCDRDLFNLEFEANAPLLDYLPKPFFTVTFGRGCPFACSFCNIATQLSSAKVRLIDPDYFMDELQALHDRFGKIGSLMIHDDILLYPKWLEEWNLKLKARFGYTPYWCQMRADFICKHPDLMRTMAECGLAWVSIGLESGSQKVLDFMSKQTTVAQNLESCRILRELGVNVFGNWMLGLPGETTADMEATAEMMREVANGGIRHSASVYCNFPGTSLAKYLKLTDGLEKRWYSRSHFPWQIALRGIDYDEVYRIQRRVTSSCPDRATRPKFWTDK